MARELEKATRETGKAKSKAAARSKNGGNDGSANPKSGASETVELLKAQHRDLQATLAKRSDANADRPAIVKEFAAAWLPHTAVEQEILVPALKDAGIDEEWIAAIAIQKDIINMLLVDLLRNENQRHENQEFGEARLEALAKQFDALVEDLVDDADDEDTGLFAAMSSAQRSNPGLNSQLKARYERVKRRFANIDESIGEAMIMLAPRRLSMPREADNGESGWFGDPEGHASRGVRRTPRRTFVSRRRSRYDDDRGYRRSDAYERGNGGRGHGGWSGDPEGHSKAARRGWANRRADEISMANLTWNGQARVWPFRFVETLETLS
jgi:Hemerythrin HHE cation binding domain